MRRFVLAVLLVALGYGVAVAEPPSHLQEGLPERQVLREGAYYADFNRDGKLDVVAGPSVRRARLQEAARDSSAEGLRSERVLDNFLTYTGDFNGDGWPDVFYVPMPGMEAYWYENPAGSRVLGSGTWP